MANKARVAREGARAAVGVIALGVAVVAVGAAVLLPLPGFSITPPSDTVTPVPTSQQRVCPGPLYELAADSSQATSLSTVGPVNTRSGSDAGSPAPATSPLAVPDDSSGGAHGTPLIVSVPAGTGSERPGIAAAQSQVPALDDLTGLAASVCGEASPDSWLVGGATTLGQTTLVLLTNPGSVQATVDLSIWGASGPINASGSNGILIPPRSQRVVPLAGLAPSVGTPVVHVQTLVGQVLASLQQSYVNGIQPEGSELIGETSAPGTHLVISGVTIAGTQPQPAGTAAATYPVTYPALRVLDTGTAPAVVRIGIRGETGTGAGNSLSSTVQPGQVAEIPLTGLTDGDYSITVDSDQPVVAAARTSVVAAAAGSATASAAASAPGGDFAWYVASDPLPGTFLVPVAPGPGATIHLVNTGRSEESVTVRGAAGTATHVTIPAGAASGVPISEAGVYTVSGATDSVASVGYSGSGVISSFAVDPAAPLAAPITVYPG
jgi:hypothetical protein